MAVNAQDGKVNFEKDVYPFLENSCVQCHKAPYVKEGRTRPTKPKADLRFDAAFGIVAGGDGGAVVVPGKPEKSSILQRTLLDEDHDDFMPPKGDVLTDKQKKILEQWIKEGADFGGWKGNEEGKSDDAKDTFE
jgi:mono/diheme cytochrome c family protein